MSRKRIDWATVRASRKRLAQLAREHPELTGPKGPENVAAWEDVLRADEEARKMVPNHPRTMTEHTAIRLSGDLLTRVDPYRDRIEKESGFRPGRADVFRKALQAFLDEHAGKAGKRRGYGAVAEATHAS